MKHLLTLTSVACAAGLGTPSAHAASVLTSSFDLNPGTTVDTTGTADWGYWIPEADGYTSGMTTGVAVNFDDLTFGDPPSAATVSKASPSIGEVFYTPTDESGGTSNQTFGYTFDGNQAGALIGSIAGSEEIFSMKFNDLGAGTHSMSFYIGASSSSRAIDIDYFVYEDDDAETSATLSATGETSGDFGSVDGTNQRIVYTLEFETTTANTDLVFNLGSAGGDGNAFTMGGYTLESETTTVIPSPTAALAGLVGLGGLCLRRRR